MCQRYRQYSNKLLVYPSHSHTFHEWSRSVRVGLYEELFLMCASVQTSVQDIITTNLKSVMQTKTSKDTFFKI